MLVEVDVLVEVEVEVLVEVEVDVLVDVDVLVEVDVLVDVVVVGAVTVALKSLSIVLAQKWPTNVVVLPRLMSAVGASMFPVNCTRCPNDTAEPLALRPSPRTNSCNAAAAELITDDSPKLIEPRIQSV